LEPCENSFNAALRWAAMLSADFCKLSDNVTKVTGSLFC